MDNISIIQIRKRAEQGITRPFLCQGDNGKWYWVKGHDAGKSSLCNEWIAGRIAQDFGLPIPPFVQAVVPEQLVKYSARDDIAELGDGIVFASEHVEGAQEYNLSNLVHTPIKLQRTTLVFDWWIQNDDRTLDEHGGNVNVLWLPEAKEARIIDHNIAFDSSFSNDNLINKHVFRDALNNWEEDFNLELEPIMLDISSKLEIYFAELPEEWTDSAKSLPECSYNRMRAILNRFQKRNDLFRDNTI